MPGSMRLSWGIEGGRQARVGSLMACCVWDLVLRDLASLGEDVGDLMWLRQKCSAMLEQKCAICPRWGQQQYRLSFLEQLFRKWQLHISRSSATKLPLLSIYIIELLVLTLSHYPRQNQVIRLLEIGLHQSSNDLFIFIGVLDISAIFLIQMGNTQCCDEEAKGGQFIQGGSRFQLNAVKGAHDKLNSVNFAEPPKNAKIVHEKPISIDYSYSPSVKKPVDRYSKDDLPAIPELLSREKPREGFESKNIVESNKESKVQSEKQHRAFNHQQSITVPMLTEQPILVEQHSFGLKHGKPSQQPQEHSINELPDELIEEEQKQKLKKNEQEKEKQIDIPMPQLTQAVRKTLQTQKFFLGSVKTPLQRRQFGDQFYEGQIDKATNLPNGFGKLYRADRSLFVGSFLKGKAHGSGALIFPNGSFYDGQFVNNQAEGNGTYHSNQLNYEGQFKRNCFHGHGSESGKSHKFNGEYYNNQRTNGVLTWSDGPHLYVYTGTFDHNLFHGQGTLSEPNGTYKGEFIEGKKHGNGVYEFNNGLKYVGQYRSGFRNGRGTLYNPNNRMAYEGQFQDGLPHGNGFVFDKNGNKSATKWIQGIDEQLLP